MKSLCFFFSCLVMAASFAQKPEFAIISIPPEIKENANAVIRLERVDVTVGSRNSLSVKTYRAVTVLNEYGVGAMNASENQTVSSISATIYDALGFEIKKIRRKDFKEVAIADGSLISDDKMVYLDYTPTQYPFTIVYESEVKDSNTSFLPSWFPLPNVFIGVERSEMNIKCPPGLGLKYKECNFEGSNIKKEVKPDGVFYSAFNLPAIKNEQYSPSLTKMAPYVLFGLNKFSLEGVDGEATDWATFSAWRFNSLLTGTDELPQETQEKVKALVGTETDPIRKAKIIYEYMQNKTRYVSIQIGIGGWKPMKAKDVDRLGYGDCKALTNYTRSMLNVVGVPSYYAVIWGGRQKRDMKEDFVSMQGNHIILAIPTEERLVWLECTSQTLPFGFLGDFTDDRLALLVKPEGGQLVRTTSYKKEDNVQRSLGRYSIAEDGSISGNVDILNRGIRYDMKESLDRKSAEDRSNYYKSYFSQINNLKIADLKLSKDQSKIEIVEKISLSASNYANLTGIKLMFVVNAFNPNEVIPQRYRTRTNPFEISRPYCDEDEIVIAIPEGFAIEAKPDNVELSDVFGQYKAEYTIVDRNHLKYKRSLVVNDGLFQAGDYEKFRKFWESIAKIDNAKCVLVRL